MKAPPGVSYGDQRPHVRIAIPVSAWDLTPQLFCLVKELEVASADLSFPVRITSDMISGYRPVEYARNILVGNFLKTDASHLWFMDQDVTPSDNLIELLDVDADIVAGTYPILIKAKESPAVFYGAYRRFENGYKMIPVPQDQESIEVDAVLNGMTIIRRKVLEDRRLWYSPNYVDSMNQASCTLGEHEAPPIFRTQRKPNGEEFVTEDMDFCQRAKALGYTVRINPRVRCGHVKKIDLQEMIYFGNAALAVGQGKELVLDARPEKVPA